MATEQKKRERPAQSQQERIASLQRRISEAVGEEVLHGVSPDCPPDIHEKFLEQVLAFEQIEPTPLFEQLVDAEVQLPHPRDLSDAELPIKLRQIFEELARLGVYVQSTDHLSDRDLYEHLWNDTLREPETTMPGNPGVTCVIDLICTGSEEHVQIWLTYYASEDDRSAWQSEFPEDALPDAKRLPYDRDRTLPQWPPALE